MPSSESRLSPSRPAGGDATSSELRHESLAIVAGCGKFSSQAAQLSRRCLRMGEASCLEAGGESDWAPCVGEPRLENINETAQSGTTVVEDLASGLICMKLVRVPRTSIKRQLALTGPIVLPCERVRTKKIACRQASRSKLGKGKTLSSFSAVLSACFPASGFQLRVPRPRGKPRSSGHSAFAPEFSSELLSPPTPDPE